MPKPQVQRGDGNGDSDPDGGLAIHSEVSLRNCQDYGRNKMGRQEARLLSAKTIYAEVFPDGVVRGSKDEDPKAVWSRKACPP
jgi:hypothetical protein